MDELFLIHNDLPLQGQPVTGVKISFSILRDLNSHRPDQQAPLVSSIGIECPIYGSLSMDACGVKNRQFDIRLTN